MTFGHDSLNASLRRLLGLLVAAILGGVAAPASAQESPPDTADEAEEGADRGSTEADGDSTESEPSDLLREASEIADQVVDIRGLDQLESIDKGIKSRSALRETLIEKLAEEQSKEEMAREAAVLRKLGLIPQDLDYRQTILDVLTEQIAGFYDEETGKLKIMEGIPLSLQRPAMAHEIFHAIQDQHFDLNAMLSPFTAQENGDFSMGRTALVEGDATVLMIDFSFYERGTLPKEGIRSFIDIPRMAHMLSELNFENLGALEQFQGSDDDSGPGATPGLADSTLSDVPAIIRRVLIFPYFSGMRFVIAMRRGRSWEDFNKIYQNPPVSTEQILHPERYAYGDEPMLLDFKTPDVLDDWTRIYDTVFGEFQMRLFLAEHLPQTAASSADGEAGDGDARDTGNDDGTDGDGKAGSSELPSPTEAATGWDGDRLMAFESPEGRVLITHLSVWDSREQAAQYHRALEESTRRRFPKARSHESSGKYGESTCLYVPAESTADSEAERICLQRWGDLVLHVEGAPSALDDQNRETDSTAYKVTRHIWSTVERTPIREEMEARKKAGDDRPSHEDEDNGED